MYVCCGLQVDGLENLYYVTTPEQFPHYTLEYVHEEIGRLIAVFRETARVEEPGPEAPPTQLPEEAQLSLDIGRRAKEGRGIGRRRRPIPPLPEPIQAPRPRMGGWFRPPFIGHSYDVQHTYYHPPQPEDHTYYQPSQPEAHTYYQPDYPAMDTQSQPAYQASPVAMASGDQAASSSQGPQSWEDADLDDMYSHIDFSSHCQGDFHPEQPIDPTPTPEPYHAPSSSPMQPGTYGSDFIELASRDFSIPVSAAPAVSVAPPAPPSPPAPPAASDPAPSSSRPRGRRRLPDRQARRRQWPPES